MWDWNLLGMMGERIEGVLGMENDGNVVEI